MMISPLRPVSRTENQAHDITCIHYLQFLFLKAQTIRTCVNVAG
jgi:hypothetical protein